ncbi:MAG: AAA family ATPase, partial [Candidatus Heimdallarchaeota archaeon]
MILDEITFVKDWWRAIKDFIDRRIFVNTTLYVSGSASMEIVRQKEYFPGRRGSGRDFQLLPLDFNAYCRHIGNLTPANYKLDNPEVYKHLNPLKLKSKSYVKLFEQYLITGGFPHPIIEYATTSKVSKKSYQIYIDWIRNDVVRMGKSESFLKEIITSIIISGCTPISYQGIAKNTTIGSVSTVSSYLDLLSNLFVLHLQTFRFSDGRVSNKKN